jgi:peptide/nickel transport system substrate-binding protein
VRVNQHFWTASVLIGTLAVFVSGCGGGGGDGQDPSTHSKIQRGGTLTMLSSSDVDYLDPGRTYTQMGVMVAQATQRPLYRYAPDDLSKALPDMAASAPEVSSDGRTVTVHLRRGVRYSPPVDREVTSADVEYAFDRIFSVNVGAPYASYFSALEGVPATPTTGVKPISGISTPDAHTIVFRLRPNRAPAFVGALALPVSAPVPVEYAKPFDAQSPSTYSEHVVATGPYMVRNDASGKVTGYAPGKTIDLVRNPSWSHATDSRPARLDAVKIQTDATDTAIASRQVLAGHDRALAQPPPSTILERVSKQPTGLVSQRVNTGGYRFIPINTTLKPFDDVNVRRAVLAVFDREAIQRARGGRTTGPVATHFLPPGIPGFKEAGGLAGPGADYLKAPGGDDAVAAAYMKKAGYPDGRYQGKETFLLVGSNDTGDKGIAEVTQAQLDFRTRLKLVAPDVALTNWCSTPAKRVLSCASSLLWLKDFPDPEPLLRPIFDGDVIAPTNNTNYPQFDDPQVNAAMDAAASVSGAARGRAWGDIDRRLVDQAASIPVSWDVATLIHSPDVAGVASVYFDGWDLSYTALRATK